MGLTSLMLCLKFHASFLTLNTVKTKAILFITVIDSNALENVVCPLLPNNPCHCKVDNIELDLAGVNVSTEVETTNRTDKYWFTPCGSSLLGSNDVAIHKTNSNGSSILAKTNQSLIYKGDVGNWTVVYSTLLCAMNCEGNKKSYEISVECLQNVSHPDHFSDVQVDDEKCIYKFLLLTNKACPKKNDVKSNMFILYIIIAVVLSILLCIFGVYLVEKCYFEKRNLGHVPGYSLCGEMCLSIKNSCRCCQSSEYERI